MAGIYLHIPFCKQACHYCDFHFSTSLKAKPAFLEALFREIELQARYLEGAEIQTVYFGGGTPSLLTAAELERIFTHLHQHHRIAPNAEITLEANPDDLTPERLQELAASPINRLSIGIQSFREADLQWMNRAHTATEAAQCVQQAQAAGFSNITIDLIYGIPKLSMEEWEANIDQALALNVQHISAYCLTVEPGTALGHFVEKGQQAPVDQEAASEHFELLVQKLTDAGFVHYEISNFGREGHFSRHNSSYWLGKHYLGLGPSAHSFNGYSRQWNMANNARYIKALDEGELPAEVEALDTATRYNEYILTSLRTIWGTIVDQITATFGSDYRAHFEREASDYFASGALLQNGNTVSLSTSGKLLADKIASDLMWVNDTE